MIHVIAIITAKPGKRDEILGHFRANMPAVHAEKGCIEYGPAVDAEGFGKFATAFGPDTFVVVETAFAPPYWVHGALWLPLTLILTFALMHPIKGAVVAWQWAMRMHGFDPAGDKNDPEIDPLPTVTTSKCAN